MIVGRVEEAGVHRAIGEQPRQAQPTRPVETGEHAANQCLAVRL